MRDIEKRENVLNTPFFIGNLEIKNRFVMCAMGGHKIYNIDGSISEDVFDYYIERAMGGVRVNNHGGYCRIARRTERNRVLPL